MRRALRGAALLLAVMLAAWMLTAPHARAGGGWTESTVASTWFGAWGAPRLSASAVCSARGHESVWVAETGGRYLDIVQVGEQDGTLFYAYGRGTPNAPGSLYREVHLGPAGTGPHRYSVALASRVWTLSIDGRVAARVPDSFRDWRLGSTKVMAEGDLPFGPASCSLPPGAWHYGGYGPQPRIALGAGWWAVRSGPAVYSSVPKT